MLFSVLYVISVFLVHLFLYLSLIFQNNNTIRQDEAMVTTTTTKCVDLDNDSQDSGLGSQCSQLDAMDTDTAPSDETSTSAPNIEKDTENIQKTKLSHEAESETETETETESDKADDCVREDGVVNEKCHDKNTDSCPGQVDTNETDLNQIESKSDSDIEKEASDLEKIEPNLEKDDSILEKDESNLEKDDSGREMEDSNLEKNDSELKDVDSDEENVVPKVVPAEPKVVSIESSRNKSNTASPTAISKVVPKVPSEKKLFPLFAKNRK